MSLSSKEAMDKEELLSIFNFLKYKAEEDNDLACLITAEEVNNIITGYRRFYSQSEGKIDDIQKRYAANKEEIESTKSGLRTQGAKMRDLESRVQTLQAEIEILKSKVK